MDLHVLFLVLLSIGATAQTKPKRCSGDDQKDEEFMRENEGSARTLNYLSLLRPGLIFRGSSSSAGDLPKLNNKRPGSIGLLHGSGGVSNEGFGTINGGGEKQSLTRNRIFGQGVGLKDNSLSQKIGNLINYQTFGILSNNHLNVNRTQQNNSGPSYQVYLPSGLHQINSFGGQSAVGGGNHGGTGGGFLTHGQTGHRPHHHIGGPAVHQGGHLSGLLGHHQNHHHHNLHPHSHHESHRPGTFGHVGHHLLNGGLLGATLLSGGGAGQLHGKPGILGLIHGGISGGGQTPANFIGHRPFTQGFVHGTFGNPSSASNIEVNNAAQPQDHHGGLLALLHNGIRPQGVLIGGVGDHLVGGLGQGSTHIVGQHGVLNLGHGGHKETQGGSFQTVTGSELKPGHVYLHLGALGVHGGQTGGTTDTSFQSAGGSLIGSGPVYGHGGGSVPTQSGQGVHGQTFATGSNYQPGGTSTSQSGQFQSQHNLHQGTLGQGGETLTQTNTGGYWVVPGQQSYQGSVYETQWRPPSAVGGTAGSTHAAETVGLSSGSLNNYNQGSNNYVSGTNVQSLYGNQNIYEANNNQHGTSQSTSSNYYSPEKIPTNTDSAGSYGISQGGYPVGSGQINQAFGQGTVSGGTVTQHSHQSSSSSSFGSNSSSEAEENTSQQSYYSGGNLVGANDKTPIPSAIYGQPSTITYIDGGQSSQQTHLNSNAHGQSNFVPGTNYLQNGGGTGGQYMGDYGSATFSGSYPHLQANHNSNDQTQGNYAHGSIIYVIQQTPLADEPSLDENESSASGSITGSGTTSGDASIMYNNKITDKPSSVIGDSGSSISTSHNYFGPNSASEVNYGGTSSFSSLQSGSHGSTSSQSLSPSGSTLSASSASHSLNSPPHEGVTGSSGNTGSSYNTQYSQPTLGSAALQSSGSSSQHLESSNSAPEYGSAVVSGNLGSPSAASIANGNYVFNANKENAVRDSVTTGSNLNSSQYFESGASAGSSSGEVLSTQTNGLGQYGSASSGFSYRPMTSTPNQGLQHITSGSSSRPIKPTTSSLSTNKVMSSGVGQTSNFSSNSGISGTSTSASNTGETHGTMSTTQNNAIGQYGISGSIDTHSSIMSSKHNESSYNGTSLGQTEPLDSSFSASKLPSNEGGQQISTITSNVGTPQHSTVGTQQHHMSGSLPSTGVLIGGESGYTNSSGAYTTNYGYNQSSAANTVVAENSSYHFTASGNSDDSSAYGMNLHGGSGQLSTTGGGQGSFIVSGTSVNNKESLDTKYNNQNIAQENIGTQMIKQQGTSTVQGFPGGPGEYTEKGSSFQSGSINNKPSASSFGTHYKPSVSGSNHLAGTESVSFIASNNNSPPSSMVSSFPETGGAHSVGSSTSQMYGLSNKVEHIIDSDGYENHASTVAVDSPTNDQLTSLSAEKTQASGMIGTAGFTSQHTFSSAPSGSSSAFTSQSSSGNSEVNPETHDSFSNGYVSSGTTGQISNQYSNLNMNQTGMTSSASGVSGSYETVSENQDKHIISSGSLASGSSVFEDGKYPMTASNTQLSSSTHGDNQLFSSSSSNFGGTGNQLSSSSTVSQHHGSAGYTPGGNTHTVSSNINGYSSMFNNQGDSSVGLATGSGINKELTGSVQTTSFRYPGLYTFKYGYVPPNSMYTSIGYPPSNSYDFPKIVYSGDGNPKTGSNSFYYQYSTIGNPTKTIIDENYNPVETNNQASFNQPVFPLNGDQSAHVTLLSNIDEEDDQFEETQTNNGIKGNLQGHFEHSTGGSFEGSVSRPFQGGVSFTGNHELNTGVSGGVNGHLGSVGNFQGFLGNAASKVGSIISGVGQAVGIIRDEGDPQTQGSLESKGNDLEALHKEQGNLRMNNEHILAPFPNTQGQLKKEHLFPVYVKQNDGNEFYKTFSDGENIATGLQTRRVNLPFNVAILREPKDITQEEVSSNGSVDKSLTI